MHRELPELRPRDLSELVNLLYSRHPKRRSHLIAVQGSGEAGLVQTNFGEFSVVPVRSEFELRRALPRLDEPEDETAEVRRLFLVPWDILPLDISGRFAGQGRVQTLPRAKLLRSRLGIEEVAQGLNESRIVEYLVSHPPELSLGLGGRVSADLLWRSWLHKVWGAPRDLNLPGMLAWAASDGRGPDFVEEMSLAEAEGLHGELDELLRRHLGTLGPVLRRAWEKGQGRPLLAFAVLAEALEGVEDGTAKLWLAMIGKGPLGATKSGVLAEVREQLRGRVPLALGQLEADDPNGAAAVLREAERLIAENQAEEVRPWLIGSPRLETSWNLRLERLGDNLLALLANRKDAKVLMALRESLETLKRHERIKKEDALAIARQAEMATRLAVWLIERTDERLKQGPATYAPVESLGRWYTEEGGYLDLARRAARPAAARPGRFGAAVKSILDETDEARRSLDVRFARALVDWYRAGRPDSAVLPIDKAAARFVVDFLKKDERRMLVILLDGMAWTQAVDLLKSLREHALPWAPIQWMARKVGDGAFPPIIASAPTLTNVSRAAFFAGKPMKAGKTHATGEDPRRWAKHRELKQLFPGPQAPKLYMGAESHLGDGSLKPSIREQIERTEDRVIALVLNAIDESLKVDPQQEHTWRVDSIRSLPALLEAARSGGRAVLLASDHGHVVADRLEKPEKTRRGGGSRWRPLDETGYDETYEVAFSGPNVWYERGDEGVVLLADDQHSYRARRDWGAHGGATLAEVIAPLVLIGWEGMDRELGGDDAAQVYSLRHAGAPPWWHLDAPTLGAKRRRKPRRKATPRQAVAPEIQTSLPGVARPAQAPPPLPSPAASPKPAAEEPAKETRALSKTATALAKSEEFVAAASRSRHVDSILGAVDYLLSRQGLAPLAAFADALGIQSWRAAQVVAVYTEVLNVDGEQVLSYDAKGQQVSLDRERLAMVFGIEVP